MVTRREALRAVVASGVAVAANPGRVLAGAPAGATRYHIDADIEVAAPLTSTGFARATLPGGAEAWLVPSEWRGVLTAVEPAPAAPPAPTEFGAWFSGNESLLDYQQAAVAGLKWARVRWFSVGLDWEGQVGWCFSAVSAARAAGLKVLLELWAWEQRPDAAHCDLPTVSAPVWRDLNHYLASTLSVDAVQFGNEPDLAPLMYSPAWPSYVVLGAGEWRQVAPLVKIVAPGMAMMPYAGARNSEWGRLRECASDVDALALHCYVEDMERSWSGGLGLAGQIATLRAACGWNGPVWLTESGGISAPSDGWHTRSESQQAADEATMVRVARAAGVPVCIHYAWRDQPITEQPERHGLCSMQGTAKPALKALKTAIGG